MAISPENFRAQEFDAKHGAQLPITSAVKRVFRGAAPAMILHNFVSPELGEAVNAAVKNTLNGSEGAVRMLGCDRFDHDGLDEYKAACAEAEEDLDQINGLEQLVQGMRLGLARRLRATLNPLNLGPDAVPAGCHVKVLRPQVRYQRSSERMKGLSPGSGSFLVQDGISFERAEGEVPGPVTLWLYTDGPNKKNGAPLERLTIFNKGNQGNPLTIDPVKGDLVIFRSGYHHIVGDRRKQVATAPQIKGRPDTTIVSVHMVPDGEAGFAYFS